MRHAVRASAAALAALLPAYAAAAPDRADVPGAGIDVLSYQVALAPNGAALAVAGRETVVLRAVRAGVDRIVFSANALTIDRATLDGRPVAVERSAGALAFVLPQPLSRGRRVRLSLDYHGVPARGLVATTTGLYTSYFACDWMVCAQEAFGDKADFTLDLRAPAGLDTLSVGSETRRWRDGADTIHRWRAPRAYPAYLFGFALGRFARAEQPAGDARLAYLSDAADADELRRRLADTPAAAAFMAERAGVPLPVATYTQLLVPGGEAQEAATWSVLGTQAMPPAPGDASRDWAIAHELAHQWWGNLVTCRTLKDFWLNEGVTVFMTAAWLEHRDGRAAYDAELDVARARVARARAAGYDKPLAWAGRYPSLGLRRAIQYSKGALFMAELRQVLGERAFWSGVRRYTRAHAGGTVESRDLQTAMEAASGRDLRPLFAAWVFGDDETAAPR